MAEKREAGFSESRLILRKGVLGRSGIPRLEVRPADFAELLRELCSSAERSGDSASALRPEHLMVSASSDGGCELSLMVDTCRGDARVLVVAQWKRSEGVEIPRPSAIWPSLRKVEAELSEIHGVMWAGGPRLEAWPGGPVFEFIPSSDVLTPEGAAFAVPTGGTA